MRSRLLISISTWHLNTTCKWFQLNHAPGNNLLCNFRLEGAGAAHTSTRIQFNNSTNINAFHVYIFPVTSVWITLQRDDILRQGKPATLSRQSINQRKIIRNIFHKAPGTRHCHWQRELARVLVLVLTLWRWRRCTEAARMRNWRWKNERLQPFGSQINTKHQTTDRPNFMLFRLFTKSKKSQEWIKWLLWLLFIVFIQKPRTFG